MRAVSSKVKTRGHGRTAAVEEHIGDVTGDQGAGGSDEWNEETEELELRRIENHM